MELQQTHGHIVDRCESAYCGFATNSGSIYFANYSNASLPAYFARITSTAFHDIQNQAGWSHAITNLQVDHNNFFNIGNLASAATSIACDGWQTEDPASDGFTYHSSAGLWVHHNTIDKTNSIDPKGCILYNGYGGGPSSTVDGGLIEHNVVKGGTFGIACTACNTIIRYNTSTGVSTTFGGSIHLAAQALQDSLQIYGNVLVTSNLRGIILQGSSYNCTNLYIVNNTIADASEAGLDIESPTDGTVANNILWWTSGSPSTAVVIQYSNGDAMPGTQVWNNNLMPDSLTYKGQTSHGTGTYTTYHTVAAWQAGTDFDANVFTSDPKFNNPSAGDYTLQGGSPAIGQSIAITIPAGPTIWGVQVPSVVLPAGANLGAL